MRFAGKRVVVTGAGSGIGRATALRFAREGAGVVVGDLDAEACARLCGEHEHIRFVPTDVSDEAAIVALVDAAGPIDVMVNNAGAGGTRLPTDEMDMAAWDETFALLLKSVVIGTREAAKAMQDRGGAVVNIASVAALSTGMAPTAYSVAKAGVLHFTKCAAADLARHRIRVNAVCPGFINTSIFTASLGITGDAETQAKAMIAQMSAAAQPVARGGQPDDIAAAVTYLASDDAAFMTGTHMLVDGGMLIGPRHSWDPDTPGLFAMLEPKPA